MADVTFSESAEQDRPNLVHLGVGFFVLTTGIYIGAIAPRFLLLG